MNNRKRYVFLIEAPKIKVEPLDRRMAEGFIATFYCGATGYNNTYSWEQKAPGGSWVDSHQFGAKSELLSVTATAKLDGYQYRCKVTNGGAIYYSAPATLTVVEVTSSGTTH